MKTKIIIILLSCAIFFSVPVSAYDKAQEEEYEKALKSISKVALERFPRWKICDPDIQSRVYLTLELNGYDESKLDESSIEIVAVPPQSSDEMQYNILTLKCGETTLRRFEIEQYFETDLVNRISGKLSREEILDRKMKKIEEMGKAKKLGKNPKDVIDELDKNQIHPLNYCYEQISPNHALSAQEASAIINYLEEPASASHSIVLSLFSQSLKIGDTGFWIRNSIGNDNIGYPFWSSGEAKTVLKRPLYLNDEKRTKLRIIDLLSYYIGASYRISGGLEGDSQALDWVKSRSLNTGSDGRMVAGFEFNMPFYQDAGISFNIEMPLGNLSGAENFSTLTDGYLIDGDSYYKYSSANVDWNPASPFYSEASKLGRPQIIPILRSSGQFTLFYNWWLNKRNFENYFRFDFGMNYNEVFEYGYYQIVNEQVITDNPDIISNLKKYTPNEFGDWVFAKVEYRNQAEFPFGIVFQYSNQILLGNIYLPLFGNWLYLEGKYATPLRGVRPYEHENFFMISPVLRLTI